MLPIFSRCGDGVRPSRVTVRGVKSQPELNGQTGVILGFDAAAARYHVRVDSGKQIKLCEGAFAIVDCLLKEEDGVPDRPAFRSLQRPVVAYSMTCSSADALPAATADVYQRFFSLQFMARIEQCEHDFASIACILLAPDLLHRPQDLGLLVNVKSGMAGVAGHGVGAWLQISEASCLHSLSIHMKQTLLERLMLDLSRRKLLEPEWLNQATLRYVICSFAQHRQYLAELVEARCLIVEHLLDHDDSTSLAGETCRLGESLELAGYYEQAAKLYAEAAHAHHALCGLDGQVAAGHGNSAIAWRRAGDLGQAEAQYVLALRLQSDIAPDLDMLGHAFDNLDRVYETHMGEHGSKGVRDTLGQVDDKNAVPFLSSALKGLMCALGDSRYCMFEPAVGSLRKQGKRDAQEALVRVARAGPDVSAFRNALLQCLLKNIKDVELHLFRNDMPSAKTDERNARKQFKKELRKQGAYRPLCDGCAQPSEAKLLGCPCGMVYYCSKGCQKQHWKAAHKAVCPTRTAK